MTLIRYDHLKINKIFSSSGLFVGTNMQNGRVNTNIINEGFGSIKGKNSKVQNNNSIFQSNKTSH